MSPTTASRVSTAEAIGVLPAEDLARARAFYEGTLGFEILDMGEGQFGVQAGKGSRFLVYERARTVAEHTALGLVVDDLAATMAEMRSSGVTFEEYDMPGLKTVDGVAEFSGGKSAWFVDPEGNIISLSEM